MLIPALIGAIAAISFGVAGRRRAEVLDGIGRVRAGWGIAVGVGGIVLMGLALFASVRSLERSMERVNRVRCATNMRHIYYAVELFAKEHQGALPKAMNELLNYLDVSTFVCNSSHDKPAPGPTTREVAANLEKREHTSYVYVGAGMTWPVGSDVVIGYEESDNHDGDGIHVLFGDGVVKWYTVKEAEE